MSDWRALGLCAEVDPEIFHPAKGQSNKAAKRICRECPVRADCLEAGLEPPTDMPEGIWGGLSKRERRRLLDMTDDTEEASAA